MEKADTEACKSPASRCRMTLGMYNCTIESDDYCVFINFSYNSSSLSAPATLSDEIQRAVRAG